MPDYTYLGSTILMTFDRFSRHQEPDKASDVVGLSGRESGPD